MSAPWRSASGATTAAPVHTIHNYTSAQLQTMTVPELLGTGHFEMSAKRLFCLCQNSTNYLDMVGSYVEALTFASTGVLLFALLVLVAQCFFCCCFEDGSRYYDPTLL